MGGHIHDSICIDVEGHLDLGNTSRGGRDAIQIECSQRVVIFCQFTLTLENLDVHTRLVIRVGCEGL